MRYNKLNVAPRNVINLMIAYELDRWSQDLSADFTLKDCLFRAAELKKNAVPYKTFIQDMKKTLLNLILVHFFQFSKF